MDGHLIFFCLKQFRIFLWLNSSRKTSRDYELFTTVYILVDFSVLATLRTTYATDYILSCRPCRVADLPNLFLRGEKMNEISRKVPCLTDERIKNHVVH